MPSLAAIDCASAVPPPGDGAQLDALVAAIDSYGGDGAEARGLLETYEYVVSAGPTRA